MLLQVKAPQLFGDGLDVCFTIAAVKHLAREVDARFGHDANEAAPDISHKLGLGWFLGCQAQMFAPKTLQTVGTGGAHFVGLVEAYAKTQGLWHDPNNEAEYSEYLELDLGAVVPSIQMKYINIKGNMNNDMKKIYMSMSDILFENCRVFN